MFKPVVSKPIWLVVHHSLWQQEFLEKAKNASGKDTKGQISEHILKNTKAMSLTLMKAVKIGFMPCYLKNEILFWLLWTFLIISSSSNKHTFGNEEMLSGKNQRPIIGILSVESTGNIKKSYKFSTSYIDAAIVKFMEMAGARVIPILIDHTDEYYTKMFNLINGLVLSGEGIKLCTSKFSIAARKLYEMAKDANDNKIYFPIWGSGLGYEALLSFIADNFNWSTACSPSNTPLPLQMTTEFKESRIFHNIDIDVYMYLTTMPVTSNFHPTCLSVKNFEAYKMSKELHALSVHKDVQTVFIDVFETISYPFYGLSWHPEKSSFEWRQMSNSTHSYESIRIAQYFANFFVEEARNNNHTFDDDSEDSRNFIYTYRTYQLQDPKAPFTDLYLFKNTSNGK